MEDHDTGNVLTLSADEDIILVTTFDFHCMSVNEIKLQLADGTGGDGHKPLFTSFAFYFDEAFFKIKVGKFQAAKLGYAKSSTI